MIPAGSIIAGVARIRQEKFIAGFRNLAILRDELLLKLVSAEVRLRETKRSPGGVVRMKRETIYRSTHFSADVLREAHQVFRSQVDSEGEYAFDFHVEIGNDTWHQDSIEEFLADYRRASGEAYFFTFTTTEPSASMQVAVVRKDNSRYTRVGVSASDRSKLEAVFSVFEKSINDSRIPEEPSLLASPNDRPKVFIGHGHSPLWRELKDHLQDQHNYNVIAYEVGARTGHGIRDILEDMLNKSSFAILVMTGEDETKNDELQPRLNVVHELGLFQGRLGFSRAIMLFEKGTLEFSNIHGVDQIYFSKGAIKETFGDVLATLHREFPPSVS